MRLFRYPGSPRLAFNLLLFLLGVSILPLVFVGISTFNTFRSVVRVELSNHILALLGQLREYLDLIFQDVESLMANLSGVDDLKSVLATDYDPAATYTRLSTSAKIGYILNNYSNLNGLVSIDVFTTKGAHYHVGATLDTQNRNEAALDRIWTAASAAPHKVVWVGVEDNVNIHSSFPKVITAAKLLKSVDTHTLGAQPVALLLVNLSIESLYTQLHKLNLGNDGILVVVDTKGHLVYHPDEHQIGRGVPDTLLAQFQGDEGATTLQIDGVAQFAGYSRSPHSGWTLIGLVPIRSLNAKSNGILNTTIAVSLLALMVVDSVMAEWIQAELPACTRMIRLLPPDDQNCGAGTYVAKPLRAARLLEAVMAAFGELGYLESTSEEQDLPRWRRTAPDPNDASPAMPGLPAANDVDRPHLSILLAEDNVVNQKLAVALLKKRGYGVDVAANGQEALRLLEEQTFDLVLMDIQMPKLDGLATTRLIRKREQATGDHIPIIAMTAHAMSGDREMCLAAGMDDYLPKPIRPADLYAKIDAFSKKTMPKRSITLAQQASG